MKHVTHCRCEAPQPRDDFGPDGLVTDELAQWLAGHEPGAGRIVYMMALAQEVVARRALLSSQPRPLNELSEAELDALEQHGHASDVRTHPRVQDAIARATAEIRRRRAAD